MDCLQYNYSTHWNNTDMPHSPNVSFNELKELYNSIDNGVKKYVIPFICIIGISGNAINLFVLSRKSLTTHMECIEKSAHVGLIALALSDFMFCVTMFPNAWMDKGKFWHDSINFWLIYDLYGEAIINCFVLSSAWLTVSMAVCRYLAICHPLRARQYLHIKASRGIIVFVFAVSILFNLPRFWMKQIEIHNCTDGSQLYLSSPGAINHSHTYWHVFKWLYFTLGIFIPLVSLLYCNSHLLRSLRKSQTLRVRHASFRQSNSTKIVTLTLTTLVILYIALVSPVELLTFFRPYLSKGLNAHIYYGIAVSICNSLQALNFSINFILYCIINVHFRNAIIDIVCFRRPSQIQRNEECVTFTTSRTQETSVYHYNQFSF